MWILNIYNNKQTIKIKFSNILLIGKSDIVNRNIQDRGKNYVLNLIKLLFAALANWWNFKIFISGTTGPLSTKHGKKHPWVKVTLSS